MKSISSTFLFYTFLFLFSSQLLLAQNGSEAIYKDIKKLGVLANVLYVAAHPDDENTRLISYLSNHLNVNTTYLSLTRGDGGQNLIGPEMREMLGLIRTYELLGARQIDGGAQLFTRANDFGYSKTAAETFTIWNREDVLSDVVWAIRNTKPDIIINRFNTDTSRPNHGHHTASAILSVEAFDLAISKSAFPEQLNYTETWQPHRVFFNTSWFFFGSREAFDKSDKSNMLAIDIGAYDAITGESNSEIAGKSRSMHKSQGFGSAETRGESLDYLDLVKDSKGISPKTLFDGIDITWNRVPGGNHIGKKVDLLESTFNFKNPTQSLPLLMEIHKDILGLSDSFWKTKKLTECEQLIKSCLGLFIEARTNKYKVGPSTPLSVSIEVINRSNYEVSLLSVAPSSSDSVFFLTSPLVYNQVYVKEITINTPDELSIPYWLEKKSTEGMYKVENQLERGLPANAPAMQIQVNILIDGITLSYTTPVHFKTVDPAEGEVTKPVSILPPVTVQAESPVLVFNNSQARELQFTLTAAQDSISGSFSLNATNKGWTISPQKVDWTFSRAGETMTTTCIITPPDKTSTSDLVPEIKFGSTIYHHQITTIDYPHLPYMSVVRDATVQLQSLDIKINERPIAYVMGAGDDVPASLSQIGFKIDIIDPENISAMSLAKYEVVILGVRAFNTIEQLAYKNKLLFDWVAAGGTMIAQYNVSRGLVTQDISPLPLTLSRDRTTEENAPVTILKPDHPAMQFPNKINQQDFDGWVQERGLYFPDKWDDRFTPLLEMHDTGEKPLQGAVLVAPFGKGYYVYSGLSWFRHLPAGNPGPYRMLSNLISLGYKNNKS